MTDLATENEDVQIFEIPSFKMELLNKEMEKLNKRAEKLGCEPLSVIVQGEITRVDPSYIRQVGPDKPIPDNAPRITYVQISIEGDAPKLAGYSFVGTLDHVVLPGSVVVKTVPGESVPEEFYQHDARCDHCDKIRRRNQTFVLYNEEEDKHVQVGRQCLKDFLGHDPAAIARYLSAVWRLMAELEDEEDERWYGGGGYREWGFQHVPILELTIAIIRRYGWVPRSSAQPELGRHATANEVLGAIEPASNEHQRKQQKKFLATLDIDKEKDHAEAVAAMEWLEEQPANNEYMHNLHAILKADLVPYSMFGFWCSVVAAYQRAQERLRLNKAQRKLNEYVGEVKERLEFDVHITGISYIDGVYGTIKLHRMLDKEGHTLIWFANTSTEMHEGGKYKIKGTVKKHDEYKDWKQTSLSRVKMIEELEEIEG